METFLAKWEDALDKLRDVNQALNEFLERTLLKNAIQDNEHTAILTGLDLLDILPSVDRCKAKIRKKGAKLEMNRRNTATRRARMTQLELQSWGYLGYSSDDDFEEEGLRMVAAAMAGRNAQRKKDPWNLPLSLWRSLTREQQKLWSELREASRVRKTKSRTPPFKLQPGKEDQYGGISRQESRRANHASQD